MEDFLRGFFDSFFTLPVIIVLVIGGLYLLTRRR